MTDDKEVAEIFNDYFVNITDSLAITQPKNPLQQIDGIYDSVEIAIKKYSSHPSVKLISANNKPIHTFTIHFVANNGVSERLRELKVKKASPIESIPSKVLRGYLNIFTDILQQRFNASIDNGIFLLNLKKVR